MTVILGSPCSLSTGQALIKIKTWLTSDKKMLLWLKKHMTLCLTQSCVCFLNRHFFLDNWLLNSDFLKSNAFLIYWPNSQPFLLTKSQILETSIFWDLHISANVLWQILHELMNELKRQIVQLKDYKQTQSLLCILCFIWNI